MAKWYGKIGYAENVETAPGYYEDVIVEREYFGDTYRNTRLLQTNQDSTNDNINVANQISIVADPYANDHIYAMRYVTFQNAKWKVTNVEVQERRLILTVGGVYNA